MMHEPNLYEWETDIDVDLFLLFLDVESFSLPETNSEST